MLTDFGIPHLFTYLIAAIHALGVLAAIHAVFTVRTAQGAIAWAVSLFFMPYLTLLPYLVFGRSRFDAYIKARRLADQEMHRAMAKLDWRPWVEETLTASESKAFRRLRALPRLGQMPCLANNQVRLLIDGEATFAAIFAALAEARQVILLQFFIVRDDALGRRLHALLLIAPAPDFTRELMLPKLTDLPSMKSVRSRLTCLLLLHNPDDLLVREP